jgi:hypothetical protein
MGVSAGASVGAPAAASVVTGGLYDTYSRSKVVASPHLPLATASQLESTSASALAGSDLRQPVHPEVWCCSCRSKALGRTRPSAFLQHLGSSWNLKKMKDGQHVRPD